MSRAALFTLARHQLRPTRRSEDMGAGPISQIQIPIVLTSCAHGASIGSDRTAGAKSTSANRSGSVLFRKKVKDTAPQKTASETTRSPLSRPVPIMASTKTELRCFD